ncbi:CRP/FNR family cyclic AMP-dependent transcriptional regulator [Kitasatospora sp. MAP12-15]|uniref:Crp/Fnr family transcriptional regulator n=1 Tax=unclassified Kitasatospora TaxID=2633591 RepID=UPI0024760511|nr:Crp/Fnr family transcriptional regulator [Kitasatospora sp. MAP12-44]MDH6114114.1 CRP/FNR family cyclic AMP-dependent transcriptional regulator [Kitasatospora sp. MAP12-44]
MDNGGDDGESAQHQRLWPSGSYLNLLSARARQAVLAEGALYAYEPGDLLLREGDQAAHLLLILSGLVKVTGVTANGHVTLLTIRAAGDLVGELGVLDDRPRSATVTAVGRVTARVITHDAFVALFRREPEVVMALMRSLSFKLRSANRVRVEQAGSPVSVRLARALVELAASYGEALGEHVAITVPLSQSDLAGLVSSSEAAVAKALRQLRESGVIETGYRRLLVRDLDALEQLAAE